MTRIPSFLAHTWVPSKRNSFGSRTAWLRPFINSDAFFIPASSSLGGAASRAFPADRFGRPAAFDGFRFLRDFFSIGPRPVLVYIIIYMVLGR
jgi:hypothetical protein